MLLIRVGLIMLLAAPFLAAQSKPAATAGPPEAVAQALVEAFNAHKDGLIQNEWYLPRAAR
jgi:hypothetical protein